MSGYSFACGTCRARLVVKNDQAVGQIHPCPKCGSMVRIPPSDLGNHRRPSERIEANFHGEDLPHASPCLADPFDQIDSLLAGLPADATSPVDQHGEVEVSEGALPASEATDTARRDRSVPVGRPIWIIASAVCIGVVGVLLLTRWLASPTHRVAPVVGMPLGPAEKQLAPTVEDRPQPIAVKADLAREERPTVSAREQRLKPPITMDGATTSLAHGSQDGHLGQSPESPMPESSHDRLADQAIDVEIFEETRKPAEIQIRLVPGVSSGDARQRISQVVESLAVPQTTLGAFRRLMEQLADIPLTIEPDALAMSRVDLAHPIAVDVRNHTVGEILAKGLRPLHLGYRLSGSHVVVQHRAVLENRPPSLQLDVSDLVQGHTSSAALASLIVDCGLVASSGGQSAPAPVLVEDGVLTVNAPPGVQFQVVQLLERLRIARSLPTRTVYGPQLLAEVPYSRRAAAVLQQTIGPPWPLRASLSQLADQIEQQATCRVLIEWPALHRAGIPFHSALEVHGASSSLKEFLATLAPIGVAYYAIDNQTLCLTSVAAEHQTGVIAVHPIADLVAAMQVSPHQWVAMLQSALVESLSRDGIAWSALDARLIYDSDSACLIARLPSSVHLRLEKGLERLRHAGSMTAVPAPLLFRSAPWRVQVWVPQSS